MSISSLLCEGANKSPDARVLSKILTGLCEIRPLGSKIGMGERVLSRREILGEDSVFGILDGDFIEVWENPCNMPKDWKINDNDSDMQLGWRWERKEIENYLIDPIVVKNALRDKAPNIQEYTSALEEARNKICLYQAARIALSTSRRRYKPLNNCYGCEHGRENYKFPDCFDEASCISGIRGCVSQYQQNIDISEENVLQAFEQYKTECMPEGRRYTNYIYAFSGKDLLHTMNSWFVENGFISALAFREKIVAGIQSAAGEIREWVNEWTNLYNILARC